ncbi:hypothetical protein GCM10009543_24310 [Leifsonia naganoensis]
MRKWITRIGIASSAALVGALLFAAPASAANFPSCTTAKSGKTGTATCAPNGQSYLFQVAIRCNGWTLLNGSWSTQKYGPLKPPGGQSSASCASNESLDWVGVIVSN